MHDKANSDYLPSIIFPDTLTPTDDIQYCLKIAKTVIMAVPSHAFASVLEHINTPISGLAWLTKGVDFHTNRFLSELVFKKWGESFPITVISGPSFAKEVANGLPTALTLASNCLSFQKTLHTLLHHDNIRVYGTDDVVGVQLCGAVKNVLAIACGVSDSLNYGANAKAALITRGLAEMSRLGVQLGAKPETFLGLAGVGDLVLTCTDNQSRNRRFGLLLGMQKTVLEAQSMIGQVVEGMHNAKQVCLLAKSVGVDMPICKEVHALIEGQVTPLQVVNNLMRRPARDE